MKKRKSLLLLAAALFSWNSAMAADPAKVRIKMWAGKSGNIIINADKQKGQIVECVFEKAKNSNEKNRIIKTIKDCEGIQLNGARGFQCGPTMRYLIEPGSLVQLDKDGKRGEQYFPATAAQEARFQKCLKGDALW